MAQRPPDFDLARALARAEFTPAARDVPAVLALLAEAERAGDAVRGLLRVDARVVVREAERLLAGDPDAASPRIADVLGRVARAAPEAGAADVLVRIAADAASPRRLARHAVAALGKLGGDAARAAVVAYWERDLAPAERAAAAAALGACGGADELARLRALPPADASVARARERAILKLERSLGRGTASAIDLEAALPAPVPVAWRCRAGLERILAEELSVAGFAPVVRGPGAVDAPLAGSLSRALAVRTWSELGFPLAPVAVPAEGARGAAAVAATADAGGLAAAVVDALAAAMPMLRALTRGPIRFRVEWAEGGHRRAVAWEVARRASLVAGLVNDPRAAAWTARVRERAGRAEVELIPRFDDPRFAYRIAEVPAASHPTLAAALARVAGVRADDVVWDPFVGSGLELIERARLGPYARLVGTDVDARAVEAARANAAAAGVERIELSRADALARGAPPGTTLVITNPPFGRRVRIDARRLLEQLAALAVRALRHGGRLVWLTPWPDRTGAILRRGGLTLERHERVDLGVGRGQLELWRGP